MSLPPSPTALGKNPERGRDNVRLRYHKKLLEECDVGIFVPTEDGKWPYEPPARALRLSRKETMYTIGLYSEPKVYPNLYTLIRDAFKNDNS